MGRSTALLGKKSLNQSNVLSVFMRYRLDFVAHRKGMGKCSRKSPGFPSEVSEDKSLFMYRDLA